VTTALLNRQPRPGQVSPPVPAAEPPAMVRDPDTHAGAA
jgi:hypothetical protein